ncbi:MAG: DUF302 domain-containing protein [Gemmatimonadales bacterium]
MNESLAFEITTSGQFANELPRVEAALAAEGFGILTRIDVAATFAKKLSREFRPYQILGACNPELAHRALTARADAGLLLPCTVTVEAAPNGGTTIRIADPQAMLGLGDFADDEGIRAVALEARQRLERVANALRTA